MADKLFFSRDTKVYLQKGTYIWELPVLEGFSFSQATNSSEITLAEMSDVNGNSRRGRQMFNNSLAPAEWSFSTYARPFKSSNSGAEKANTISGKHHAVEEVLWAQMVGDGTYDTAADTAGGAVFGTANSITFTATDISLQTDEADGVSNSNEVTFDNVTNVKVGMTTTIGNVSTHVISIDSTAKTLTFADPVTIADDAAVTIKRKLGADTTVTNVPTTTNGSGGGATVQIAYDEDSSSATGFFTFTIDNAGSGYSQGDQINVSSAAIAAAFSTALGRTLGADYTGAANNGVAGTPPAPSSNQGTTFTGFTRTDDQLDISFANSNKTTLGTFDLLFVLGGSKSSSSEHSIYKISNCCVNEASLDFDLDGITTINWSGMGTLITDLETSFPAGTKISEGASSTSNFIRNRLTSLEIASTVPGTKTYDLTLTGGNITISNNMTYLTPETLGVVNTPLGHVTGTRSVTGSFNCYLNRATDSSAELFEQLITNTGTVTNDFGLTFNVGGATGTPRIEFAMDSCHLELPTHSIEDVVSLEATFHALPDSVDDTDELSIRYVGA